MNNINEFPIDILVRSLYKNYGLYINQFRQIPLLYDGLKPVERRVLITAYEVAKSKFVKCNKIDGTCLANYHPHGGSYGTIVQMVNQGFLEGQGNFGTDCGLESVGPAASRYTEARLSASSLPFFDLIDYVPWEKTETEEKEPLFIPTLFPLCLLGNYNSSGIAFGCVTLMPCYSAKDLYKRLKWILDGKKGTGPIIKPKTDANILSDDSECLKLLTTGIATIKMEGKYTENPNDFCINITSIPTSSLFSLKSVLSKFNEELDNQDIGFIDLSTDKTNLEIRVMRQRNKSDTYNAMISKIKSKGILQANVSYKCNSVLSDGTVVTKSIDDMLFETYTMYTGVCQVMLDNMIKKCQAQLDELDVLFKIRPHLQTHMTSSKTQDEIIKLISEDSGCQESDIKFLFGKYRISKLLSLNPDINVIIQEKSSHEYNLSHISDFVNQRYEENISKII